MTAIIKYNLLHFVKGGNTHTHKKIGHYYNSTRHWHKSAIFTIRDDFPKTTVPTKPVEPYQRTAGNTAIKVCLFQVDAWYQADIESGSNQSRAMRRGQKLQCMGVRGGRKEWWRAFHIWSACVSVCPDLNWGAKQFDAHCFTLSILWEVRVGTEDMATGRRAPGSFVLCS